jgi:hypothetical protein
MPIDEDFINAEFFKFVGKINRFLKVSDKKLLYFNYEKSGFVEVGIWDEKNHHGTNFITNLTKEGAFNENTNTVSEN